MEMKLSQTALETFVGNVLPLRLLGVEEYGMGDISWSVTGDCLQLTTFEKAEKGAFTDGVLLTILKEGHGQVAAQYHGCVYTCAVTCRSMKHTETQKGLSYYIGNLHEHTAQTHDPELFPLRPQGVPADYLKQILAEGVHDFTAITDHADLLNDREFFRGVWDAYQVEEKDLVVFPGSEAEVSPLWDDRYGVEHKVGGEIVVVNCDSYASTGRWSKFFDRYATSPFAFGMLAHPQIIGISRKGIWNFQLDKNRGPEFTGLIQGVEMGNGKPLDSNFINEHTYSQALDNGFFVSTACTADMHGPKWGARLYPGKTILMAPEKSREAFLDALQSRRFYASESGNVKVYYEVNGQTAPCTLKPAESYRFHVELGLLRQELGGMPVRLQLISDYGKTLWETDAVEETMDFEIQSNTARWFFLRMLDESGNRTWSVPVLTGRECDPTPEEELQPIEKAGVTAVEEASGADAALLLCDDPKKLFYAEGPNCAILIDLQQPTQIDALGLYHVMMDIKAFRAEGIPAEDRICELPVQYQLETGMTPDTMQKQAEGLFRVFGAEEIIRITTQTARFVRLRILSNVGLYSGRPDRKCCRTGMAELTVYRR